MLNKILSVVLLTLVTMAGFFMYQQQDIGNLSLSFGEFQYQTNLVIVLAVTLIAMFLVSMLAQIVHWFADAIAYFGSSRQLRLSDRASESMVQGLIELAEGRFARAEKLLLTEIRHNDNALLAYLGAARAAQQQNAYKRRDKYLRLAHEVTPQADTAIKLTKAELQLAHDQHEQALTTLTMLSEDSPKHAYVLKLLAGVYRHQSEWHKLQNIIPELKKQDAMSTDEISALETETWKGLLEEIAVSRNTKALIEFWSAMPKLARQDAGLLAHYAQLLIKLDASGEAEQVLRQSLSNHWNEEVVALYSTIDVSSDNKQLETAEGWLHKHQQNAYLLLALGNMCTNRSLWGKARNYYEASISVKPMPENYLRLARLLEEHMGEQEAAQEYYRQGLHMMAGSYGESAERLLTQENTLGNPVEGKPDLKVV